MKKVVMVKGAAVVLFLAAIASACSSNDAADEAGSVPTVTASSPSTSPSPEAKVGRMFNLRGLDSSEARNELKRLRLNLRIHVEQEYSSKVAGTVLDQDPSGGAALSEESVVYLTVARPFPVIPNVVGKPLTTARELLRRHGFKMNVRQQVSSLGVGTVISQTPKGGTEALPGRVVTLFVAKAAPPPPPDGDGGGVAAADVPRGTPHAFLPHRTTTVREARAMDRSTSTG